MLYTKGCKHDLCHLHNGILSLQDWRFCPLLSSIQVIRWPSRAPSSNWVIRSQTWGSKLRFPLLRQCCCCCCGLDLCSLTSIALAIEIFVCCSIDDRFFASSVCLCVDVAGCVCNLCEYKKLAHWLYVLRLTTIPRMTNSTWIKSIHYKYKTRLSIK